MQSLENDHWIIDGLMKLVNIRESISGKEARKKFNSVKMLVEIAENKKMIQIS